MNIQRSTFNIQYGLQPFDAPIRPVSQLNISIFPAPPTRKVEHLPFIISPRAHLQTDPIRQLDLNVERWTFVC
jgi:hypothetical protein